VAAKPDVIVIDLECTGIDGIAAANALRERAPGSAIVMLSIHDGECLRAATASAGVSEFVAKHDADCALIDAIHSAAGRGGGASVDLPLHQVHHPHRTMDRRQERTNLPRTQLGARVSPMLGMAMRAVTARPRSCSRTTTPSRSSAGLHRA
jgi:DNA-binding NarL/FixJ family response regulator